MLFKKNEKKEELKRAIKATRCELAERRKEDREWIDQFVKETDPEIARALIICIRKRAERTYLLETKLEVMNAQYKTL